MTAVESATGAAIRASKPASTYVSVHSARQELILNGYSESGEPKSSVRRGSVRHAYVVSSTDFNERMRTD